MFPHKGIADTIDAYIIRMLNRSSEPTNVNITVVILNRAGRTKNHTKRFKAIKFNLNWPQTKQQITKIRKYSIHMDNALRHSGRDPKNHTFLPAPLSFQVRTSCSRLFVLGAVNQQTKYIFPEGNREQLLMSPFIKLGKP